MLTFKVFLSEFLCNVVFELVPCGSRAIPACGHFPLPRTHLLQLPLILSCYNSFGLQKRVNTISQYDSDAVEILPQPQHQSCCLTPTCM